MLKRQCPDLRLFIFTSDLVYASLAQNRAFLGMMMVTTYPLYPANQVWTGSYEPGRPMRIFSGTACEGTYNACLRLLGEHGRPETRLAEYAPPSWDKRSPPFRPALWVTLVGHRGLWPLRTLPGREEFSALESVDQTPIDERLPHRTPQTWELVLYFLTAFNAAFAAAVCYWSYKPDDGKVVHRGLLSMFRIDKPGRWCDVLPLMAAAIGLLAPACFVSATHIEFQYWHGLYQLSGNLQGGMARTLIQGGLCVLSPALVLAGLVCCFQPRRSWWFGLTPACLAVPVFFCWWIYNHEWLSLPYVYRSVHLGNGVSPLVPVLLLSAAFAWYAGTHLNQVRLCRFKPAELPSVPGDVFLGGSPAEHSPQGSAKGGIQDAYQWMSQALDDFWFKDWSIIAAVLWGFSILLWWLTSTQLVSVEEGTSFEKFYTVGLFFIYGALLLSCARFVHLWLGLSRMLNMLGQHPIRNWMKRLAPERSLSPANVWKVGGSRGADMNFAISIERLRIVAAEVNAGSYADGLKRLESNAGLINAALSRRDPLPAGALKAINHTFTEVAGELLNGVIERASETGSSSGDGTGTARAREPLPMAVRHAAEEFVAIRFAAVIQYVNLHMKNLLEFVAAGLILAIASLMSYPFEPHHFIMTAISTCFFVMSGVFLFALIQMNRNAIISYLSGTKPGQIDGNLLHVASFGALPLVTVLSAQFPTIGGFLFAWVKPALEAIK
jgi:hypothetical protein